MKLKIEDLDEIKNLSQHERHLVLEEYRKAYHFLLFYGKLIGLPILILSLGYVVNLIGFVDWPFKLLILISVSYPVSLLVKIIEVNVVAKKVIRDLLKDFRDREKSTT